MTETLPDVYTAGTGPEDFAEADLPPDLDGERPGDVPWGYTVDSKTGEMRPKKAPGRPRNQPGAEELAKQPEITREPDRPPQRPAGRKPQAPAAPADEVKMPKGGVIAAGVNKLYRRAGKIVRGFENGDPMGIGQALIECTRIDPEVPEDERELTVGEAWENLAKSNPRVRAFILKVIAGGDIGDLVMAHAPIGIAFAMKPWVQKLIPFGAMVDSLTEPDEDEEDGTAMPGGLTRDDLQQMADLTDGQAQMLAKKARDMAHRAGVHLTEGEIAEATAKAAQMAADGQGLPPGLRRQQPKRPKPRAQRTGAR